MSTITISGAISIEPWELREKFVRSGGPGGQNVNKVSTAVQLRFDVKHSPNLPDALKTRILTSGDGRLTKEGELVIMCDTHRTQEANRREASDRLVAFLRQAIAVAKPRKATRPTSGSVKRRLETKAKRGVLKKSRSKPIDD